MGATSGRTWGLRRRVGAGRGSPHGHTRGVRGVPRGVCGVHLQPGAADRGRPARSAGRGSGGVDQGAQRAAPRREGSHPPRVALPSDGQRILRPPAGAQAQTGDRVLGSRERTRLQGGRIRARRACPACGDDTARAAQEAAGGLGAARRPRAQRGGDRLRTGSDQGVGRRAALSRPRRIPQGVPGRRRHRTLRRGGEDPRRRRGGRHVGCRQRAARRTHQDVPGLPARGGPVGRRAGGAGPAAAAGRTAGQVELRRHARRRPGGRGGAAGRTRGCGRRIRGRRRRVGRRCSRGGSLRRHRGGSRLSGHGGRWRRCPRGARIGGRTQDRDARRRGHRRGRHRRRGRARACDDRQDRRRRSGGDGPGPGRAGRLRGWRGRRGRPPGQAAHASAPGRRARLGRSRTRHARRRRGRAALPEGGPRTRRGDYLRRPVGRRVLAVRRLRERRRRRRDDGLGYEPDRHRLRRRRVDGLRRRHGFHRRARAPAAAPEVATGPGPGAGRASRAAAEVNPPETEARARAVRRA